MKSSILLSLTVYSLFSLSVMAKGLPIVAELSGTQLKKSDITFLAKGAVFTNTGLFLKSINDRFPELYIIVTPSRVKPVTNPYGTVTFKNSINWKDKRINQTERQWFLDNEKEFFPLKYHGLFVDPYKVKNIIKSPYKAKPLIFIKSNVSSDTIAHEVIHYLIYQKASKEKSYKSHREVYNNVLELYHQIYDASGTASTSTPSEISTFIKYQHALLKQMPFRFEEVDVDAIMLEYQHMFKAPKPLVASSLYMSLLPNLNSAITEYSEINTNLAKLVNNKNIKLIVSDKVELAEAQKKLSVLESALRKRQGAISKFKLLLK